MLVVAEKCINGPVQKETCLEKLSHIGVEVEVVATHINSIARSLGVHMPIHPDSVGYQIGPPGSTTVEEYLNSIRESLTKVEATARHIYESIGTVSRPEAPPLPVFSGLPRR